MALQGSLSVNPPVVTNSRKELTEGDIITKQCMGRPVNGISLYRGHPIDSSSGQEHLERGEMADRCHATLCVGANSVSRPRCDPAGKTTRDPIPLFQDCGNDRDVEGVGDGEGGLQSERG
jgi:hypothetical protein